MASGPQQPRPQVERVEPGQMIPEPQQDLLRCIFGVGAVRQQGMCVTINLIAMPLAQDFELEFTDHPLKPYNE